MDTVLGLCRDNGREIETYYLVFRESLGFRTYIGVRFLALQKRAHNQLPVASM